MTCERLRSAGPARRRRGGVGWIDIILDQLAGLERLLVLEALRLQECF